MISCVFFGDALVELHIRNAFSLAIGRSSRVCLSPIRGCCQNINFLGDFVQTWKIVTSGFPNKMTQFTPSLVIKVGSKWYSSIV